MILDSDFRSFGFFWFPDNPDNQVVGLLSISRNIDIVLELVGPLFTLESHPKDSTKFDIVFGKLESNKYIVIKQLTLIQPGDAFLFSFQKYHFNATAALIFNDELPSKYDYTNNLTFSIQNTEEWLKYMPFTVSSTRNQHNPRISYKAPPKQIVQLSNSMTLRIHYDYCVNNIFSHTQCSLSNQVTFSLKSTKKQHIEEFYFIADLLRMLFSISLDRYLHITHIESKYKSYFPSKFYIKGIEYDSNSLPNYPNLYPISFDILKHNLPDILNRWIELYKISHQPINLFLNIKRKNNTISEINYLSLCQATEGFHRINYNKPLFNEEKFNSLYAKIIEVCSDEDERNWIKTNLAHSNAPYALKRIKELVHPFKKHFGKNSLGYIVKDIVDLRDCLTHQDNNNPLASIYYNKLEPLFYYVKLIFEMSLMKAIINDDALINEHIKNSNYFKYMLDLANSKYRK